MFPKEVVGRRCPRRRHHDTFLSRIPAGHHAAGVIWLALGATAATAQTPGNDPLDMVAAVRAAVRTHPAVRGAGEQIQQANAGVDAARAGYKPQINGGIENQHNTYRNNTYDSRNVYTAKLTGSQMVYDFGKVAGTVDKAKSGVRASAAQMELATDDIGLNTAQAWVDAHMQQALLQIAREQLNAVMSIAALVTERAEKGATNRSDVEQANSRVNAVRSQLLGAEAEALRASLILMHLTGRAAPVAITGPIPPVLEGAACHGGNEADSPAVRLASARRDAASADLAIAKAQRLPTVTLDGSAGHALTNGSRLYGEYRTTGQVGLNLAMPLYQGGRAQAQERDAFHQLRAFEEAVEQARLENLQGFADASAQAYGWMQRAPVLQARVNSIDTTRDLYRKQYLQLGARSLIDLLNAEQEYHAARVEQVQGLHMQYRLGVQCLYFSDDLRDTFGLDEPDLAVGPMITAGQR